MQTQPSPRLPQRPPTEEQPSRPDLHVVSTVRSPRLFRAFALTRTPGGLFNFQERGLQPAPQALIALVAESGVLVVLGAELLTAHLVRREPRTVAVNRV